MIKMYRDLQKREKNVTSERIKNRFVGIEITHQMVLELRDDLHEERREERAEIPA